MLATLPFQYYGIDAVPAKNVPKQQSSRASAYDRHLSSHRRFHKRELPAKSSTETAGARISFRLRNNELDVPNQRSCSRIVSHSRPTHNSFGVRKRSSEIAVPA